MRRLTAPLSVLLLSGCFSEPETGGRGSDTETSIAGSSTAAIDDDDDDDDTSTSSGAPDGTTVAGSGSSTGCRAGQWGCPCAEDSCETGTVCVEGQCVNDESICGDGEVQVPEDCDDGNTSAGDGCSPQCTGERACLLAHLGGGDGTSLVRAYTIDFSGMISNLDQIGVPSHEPPTEGAGSHLSRAALACQGRAFFASANAGTITTLTLVGDLLEQADAIELPGVRELACDPAAGQLLAVRTIDNGFAVHKFDIAGGGLTPSGAVDIADASTLGVRDVRMALDTAASAAWVHFAEDDVMATPVRHVRVEYSDDTLTSSPVVNLPVMRNEVTAIGYAPAHAQVVALGSQTSGGPAAYRTDTSAGPAEQATPIADAPWNTRRNGWPIRFPTGESGFAMGGADGVTVGTYTKDGDLQIRGPALAVGVSDTFTRTAFNGAMLIVASPSGFETYDLTQQGPGGEFTQLGTLAEVAMASFAAAAVIPCT